MRVGISALFLTRLPRKPFKKPFKSPQNWTQTELMLSRRGAFWIVLWVLKFRRCYGLRSLEAFLQGEFSRSPYGLSLSVSGKFERLCPTSIGKSTRIFYQRILRLFNLKLSIVPVRNLRLRPKARRWRPWRPLSLRCLRLAISRRARPAVSPVRRLSRPPCSSQRVLG